MASRLSGIIGIPISTLPVRYLDIPLTTKQLKVHDCRVLIDKIRDIVNGWEGKYLSFAGRLVLVQSVIFGIYNYWYQTVFLPMQIIKDIEKLIKAYLWKGATDGMYLPKLRQMIRTHVKKEVKNGIDTNCLFDNWHGEGVLVDMLSGRDISILRIGTTDTVAQVLEKIRWPTGRAQNEAIQRFREGFPSMLSNGDDKLL
ncbi:hypothetical protein LIER_19079 [Lithospermum erythrorhizon]|uniref:Uncharacterized protein n=1 Tax=Lithospermum erythrorhizon TaxID=34254 RepID=A0AAV3QHL2_LITER